MRKPSRVGWALWVLRIMKINVNFNSRSLLTAFFVATTAPTPDHGLVPKRRRRTSLSAGA